MPAAHTEARDANDETVAAYETKPAHKRAETGTPVNGIRLVENPFHLFSCGTILLQAHRDPLFSVTHRRYVANPQSFGDLT